MAETTATETKEELLKEALAASIKVLESATDPIVVEEAKRIENVVSQLDTLTLKALTDTEEVKTTASGWWSNLLNFDQSLIKKYGVFVARCIEVATLAIVTIKVFYLG